MQTPTKPETLRDLLNGFPLIEQVELIRKSLGYYFKDDLQSLLWALIVNGIRDKREAAFHVLTDGSLILTDRGEKGYNPTPCAFDERISRQEQNIVIEALNEAVFGLTAHQANKIILSTL